MEKWKPNKAGKFLLISKKRADFFPPHNSDEVDPSMSLRNNSS